MSIYVLPVCLDPVCLDHVYVHPVCLDPACLDPVYLGPICPDLVCLVDPVCLGKATPSLGPS